MENSFEKVAMKVSFVSIVANIILSLFKFLAGMIAHSGAMISDSIHSASDVFSTLVVIVGIKMSGKNQIKNIPTDMSAWNAWQRLFFQQFLLLQGWELAAVQR